MHFLISSFVYRAANKSQLGIICEKRITMLQFTPPEIWHAVLFGIHGGSSSTNISECLGDRQ